MRREEGETSSSIPPHPHSPVVGPLEDDDLLLEILLRLPPQPSSLPRASAVCRRWRLLVTDPGFSRRFRRYHCRNIPIIGFYNRHLPDISFVPTLKGPDCIPPRRLSLQPQRDDQSFSTFGCRHGLVLVHVRHFKPLKHHILVWDPITDEQHNLGIPLGIDTGNRFNGAVLRATGDFDHFQVVLIGNSDERRAVASVYSSETGVWSNLVSTSTSLPLMDTTDPFSDWCFNGISFEPAVLVRNSLYWLLGADSVGILEFDLERQILAVIGLPVRVGVGSESRSNDRFSITQAEDGGLGFLSLSGFSAKLWKRKTKYDGIASWVMEKNIELDKLLKIPMDPNRNEHVIKVIGFAENNNAVFLYTKIGIVAIHLESLQFKKLPGSRSVAYYYPFESVWCM
ncbi:unnamed protein product [Triticum turgidum subsp. durum]|uniref:F-box domain-containing protein n=1 Tax=Triticum turgidum subsp. durum TaxID=4567 RepID=A0A9R0XTG6_TRITD|nr:unnamed protein product [Triticum turgidum subsp. durum]